MPPCRCPQVDPGLVVPRDGHELFHVFSVFLGQNIDGVVMGNDTDQVAVAVDDRQGDQIVFLDFERGRLLIVGNIGKNDVPVHDLPDTCLGPGQDQVFE